MENFLNTQLHPAETCVVCTEPFSATHQPVALPCKHIFGNECIRKWLKDGTGNTSSCPTCRYVVVEKSSAHASFDPASIWKLLSEQSPERLHSLMMRIWTGLQSLWSRKPDGKFSVTEILERAVLPALIATANRTNTPGDRSPDPVLDCYNLVATSWDSLGRPDYVVGLAVPLVRLAWLMSSASTTMPKWLTTTRHANRLIWRANACLGLTEPEINWDFIIQASQFTHERYFPLLYLHTVLMSQSIVHNPKGWPMKRHGVMNLVVERCCTKISGGGWCGTPTNEFKDVLLKVYEELRRFQLEKKKVSLRGHDGEEDIVKGIWALAGWVH